MRPNDSPESQNASRASSARLIKFALLALIALPLAVFAGPGVDPALKRAFDQGKLLPLTTGSSSVGGSSADLPKFESTLSSDGLRYKLSSGAEPSARSKAVINVQTVEKASSPGQEEYDRGISFLNGTGATRDPSQAANWLLIAAEKNHAEAQAAVARLYARGDGLPKDPNASLSWKRRAAENGDAESQFWFFAQYAYVNQKKDWSIALKWLHAAAERGYAEAQSQLGNAYHYGRGEHLKADIPKALVWYRKAADRGDASAQEELAEMYSKGEGVPKDERESTRWYLEASVSYRRAAESGSPVDAHNYVVFLFRLPTSLLKDRSEIAKWLPAIVDLPHNREWAAAWCSKLAFMYEGGEGGPKDATAALRWFVKAAEKGDADGQYWAGTRYYLGWGVTRDMRQAFNWVFKAAMQGHSHAQWFIGGMYSEGNGVLKDEIEGLAWTYVSALSGLDGAVNDRGIMESQLGRQASMLAQQRSKELLAQVEAKKLRSDAPSGIAPNVTESQVASPRATGSGAFVSHDGHIITAAHVVTGATRINVLTYQGELPATLLRIDEANDLAVLKLTGGPFFSLPIGPSRGIRLGQSVATIGFPNVGIQGFSPKVTKGEISSLNGIGDDPRAWQVSVPVQPGNSGGPLLDEYGNLVGVVVSKLGIKAAKATGDIPQNVNYAVKSVYASALLDQYLSSNSPEPSTKLLRFEDMVAKAQQAVVLILAY